LGIDFCQTRPEILHFTLMKRPFRLLLALFTAAVAALPAVLHAQHTIGFVEKFALAPDRGAALKELIPGTEEYYFYHALHFQNSGRPADLDALIAQWAKRTPDSPLLREIRHRQALLNYDTSPKATLDYLKRVLAVNFDHQQDTLHPKPNLPIVLDQALIGTGVYFNRAVKEPKNRQ
jgi:hypothetical protein